MAILEALEIIGVVLVGAVGSVLAGGLFEVIRAFGDPKRRPEVRSRSLRENIRHMLS